MRTTDLLEDLVNDVRPSTEPKTWKRYQLRRSDAILNCLEELRVSGVTKMPPCLKAEVISFAIDLGITNLNTRLHRFVLVDPATEFIFKLQGLCLLSTPYDDLTEEEKLVW